MFCIYEALVLTATILVFISFNFNPSYDIIILYYMKDFFYYGGNSMKYPRAAMVHKFLFMMLVELAPYTRGTLDFLPISHEMFRLLMDIVRDEHNIPLYNEMRSYALDYQGLIHKEFTNYDIIGKRTKVLIMMLVNSFYMFNRCDERYFNLYKDKIRGVRDVKFFRYTQY